MSMFASLMVLKLKRRILAFRVAYSFIRLIAQDSLNLSLICRYMQHASFPQGFGLPPMPVRTTSLRPFFLQLCTCCKWEEWERETEPQVSNLPSTLA
jgi:hypothetical protein